MDSKSDKPSDKPSDKLRSSKKLEFRNGADAMGFWFAAVVLCAVLAAGVIVYRTGNSDLVTASNDVAPVATAK